MIKTNIFNLILGKMKAKESNLLDHQSNIFLDINKPFAVLRDDGKLIHQFKDYYEASVFSVKLNISYEENGIKAYTKVLKLSD